MLGVRRHHGYCIMVDSIRGSRLHQVGLPMVALTGISSGMFDDCCRAICRRFSCASGVNITVGGGGGRRGGRGGSKGVFVGGTVGVICTVAGGVTAVHVGVIIDLGGLKRGVGIQPHIPVW